MSAAALEWETVGYDPLRDSRHKNARAAREQTDWLSWLEIGGAAARTLEEYERRTAELLRLFPDKTMAEFTDGDLLHAIRRVSPKSRPDIAVAYRSWFKWARRTRRIAENPCDYLPDFKRKPQPPIEVFTEAEEEALCALPLIDGALMVVLFDGGLRQAEAIHLRMRRCNLRDRRLIIREGAKGSRERVVPMSVRMAAAVADLELVERLRPDDFLWYDKPGGSTIRRSKPIGKSTFYRWWDDCLKAAVVPRRKPHTTRHTFATRWRRRGLDLDDVQLLLGHASIQTTSDLYVHRGTDDVADKMDRLLRGESTE